MPSQNGPLHPRHGLRGHGQTADPQTESAQPQMCGPGGVRAHRARHEVCRQGNQGDDERDGIIGDDPVFRTHSLIRQRRWTRSCYRPLPAITPTPHGHPSLSWSYSPISPWVLLLSILLWKPTNDYASPPLATFPPPAVPPLEHLKMCAHTPSSSSSALPPPKYLTLMSSHESELVYSHALSADLRFPALPPPLQNAQA